MPRQYLGPNVDIPHGLRDFLDEGVTAHNDLEREVLGEPEEVDDPALPIEVREARRGEAVLDAAALQGVLGEQERARAEREAAARERVSLAERVAALEARIEECCARSATTPPVTPGNGTGPVEPPAIASLAATLALVSGRTTIGPMTGASWVLAPRVFPGFFAVSGAGLRPVGLELPDVGFSAFRVEIWRPVGGQAPQLVDTQDVMFGSNATVRLTTTYLNVAPTDSPPFTDNSVTFTVVESTDSTTNPDGAESRVLSFSTDAAGVTLQTPAQGGIAHNTFPTELRVYLVS